MCATGGRFPIIAQAGILAAMPPDDFTGAERAALIAELKQTVARDRFPLSQRIKLLRAILDKLEPPPRLLPTPKPPVERGLVLDRKKRRR